MSLNQDIINQLDLLEKQLLEIVGQVKSTRQECMTEVNTPVEKDKKNERINKYLNKLHKK